VSQAWVYYRILNRNLLYRCSKRYEFFFITLFWSKIYILVWLVLYKRGYCFNLSAADNERPISGVLSTKIDWSWIQFSNNLRHTQPFKHCSNCAKLQFELGLLFKAIRCYMLWSIFISTVRSGRIWTHDLLKVNVLF
jgi:hypothetical protein